MSSFGGLIIIILGVACLAAGGAFYLKKCNTVKNGLISMIAMIAFILGGLLLIIFGADLLVN